MGGSGPPTSVQTPPEICANPLKSVLHIGGCPMHVYCNFLLLTSKEKWFGPPHFFWAGDATAFVGFCKQLFVVVSGPFALNSKEKLTKLHGMDPHVLIDALVAVMGNDERELCYSGTMTMSLILRVAISILGTREKVSFLIFVIYSRLFHSINFLYFLC